MSEITLFDQLLECLDRTRNDSPYVQLSQDNIAFIRKLRKTPATPRQPPAPTQQRSAPVATPATPAPQQSAPEKYTTAPAPPPVVREALPAYKAATPLPEAAPIDVSGFNLDDLQTKVTDCERCGLCSGRTQTVFGVGNPDADLMFIGEGPGEDEDRQGVPFVGAAGQLLTKVIVAMKLARDDVYIASIVKCRLPDNRNPEPDEAAACLPYIQRQIELVKPKVIVTLGAVPLRFLMNQKGIRRLRGNWLDYNGIPVMPTLHPSYLLRVPDAKRPVWEDMLQVMARLGIKK
jgi:DNA polymerase